MNNYVGVDPGGHSFKVQSVRDMGPAIYVICPKCKTHLKCMKV